MTPEPGCIACRPASPEMPHWLLPADELSSRAQAGPSKPVSAVPLPAPHGRALLTLSSPCSSEAVKRQRHDAVQHQQMPAQHHLSTMQQQQQPVPGVAGAYRTGITAPPTQMGVRQQNGAAPGAPSAIQQAGYASAQQGRQGRGSIQAADWQTSQAQTQSSAQSQFVGGMFPPHQHTRMQYPYAAPLGQTMDSAATHNMSLHQQQQQQYINASNGAYHMQQGTPWQPDALHSVNGHAPHMSDGSQWRLPVSKQKLSLNALSRMPYQT